MPPPLPSLPSRRCSGEEATARKYLLAAGRVAVTRGVYAEAERLLSAALQRCARVVRTAVFGGGMPGRCTAGSDGSPATPPPKLPFSPAFDHAGTAGWTPT